MAKIIGKKAALAKERARELERLESIYVEGTTNIDWDQVTAEHSKATLQRIFDGQKPDLPLLSKEVYFDRELQKWESRRVVLPSSRVQSPMALRATYRQRFLESVRKYVPSVFGDLRELGPLLAILTHSQEENQYLEIFNNLRDQLSLEILPGHPIWEVDTPAYRWGEIHNLLTLSSCHFASSQHDKATDLSPVLKQYINDNSEWFESVCQIIESAFQPMAKSKDLILASFFAIEQAVFNWAHAYNLKKDWLVEYAFHFIHQFSTNERLQVSEIEIGLRSYTPLPRGWPLKFKADGWLASEEGEIAHDYRNRIVTEFEEFVDSYLLEVAWVLELDTHTRKTKPPQFKALDWLVHAAVLGWSDERIVEKFFRDSAANRTLSETASLAFENKRSLVRKQIAKSIRFGLPKPQW